MLAIIVARSRNNVIGKNGKIPWKIEGEQSQFKELTTGNVVVMGRKTYEEIGHPLPNRKTIVVSSTRNYEDHGLTTVRSLKEAMTLAGNQKTFIAGGYGLYKEALPYADLMYITEVDLIVEDGNVFFPDFDESDFDVSLGETGGQEIKYIRKVYKRRKSK